MLKNSLRQATRRAWKTGPISDPSAIVLIVGDGLKYDRKAFKEFLNYEEPLTTPEKIRAPAAHYRSLLTKFFAARAHRRQAEIKRIERETIQRREAPQPTCSIGNPGCNGNGEVYDASGAPVGICSCDAAHQMPAETRRLFEGLIKPRDK